MLTDKAKEIFNDWYLKNHNCSLEFFYTRLVNSMQFGVYVDFADSLGYEFQVDVGFYADIYRYGECLYSDTFKTRNEAREKIIEVLNEIINKYERINK